MSYDDPPEIPILLLGDSGVGKSTFLSRLTLGHNALHASHNPLPTLHDLNQPFPFNIRLYARKYRFEFSDTASPTHYTLLRPAVIILCYSIASPESLESLKTNWKKVVEGHFNYDEAIPVIVLGLQRDVREKEDYDGLVRTGVGRDGRGRGGRDIVYPQEALRVAQEMRCDRYCECSALTGDLCREVFEDIAKTAAMTTTDSGGKTRGMECAVM
ncbi:hypothetical protein B0A54_15064 [Friedmanniomyces endolithicus]|uniref:Uncharacterized protein n=1 Tax=Friedmanniomyces endolithicus TaxID=329885 RepID=A0A4U0U4M7_9PEZI|nr:hypothetical protein B0A54_15064 [Friedmanniomyces endolithicus]